MKKIQTKHETLSLKTETLRRMADSLLDDKLKAVVGGGLNRSGPQTACG